MQDIEKLLSGRDGEALRALAETPEARQLSALVDPAEAEAAAKAGDVAALRGMLTSILGTPEGRRLAQGLSKALEK